MLGGEDVFIRPIEESILLAFAADGISVVGVSSGEEEHERDAGEDGEEHSGADKGGHVFSPFCKSRYFYYNTVF